MSHRPLEHEVVALAERILVQSAGGRIGRHTDRVFPASTHLLEQDVKDAFRAAEAFLRERNTRAAFATDSILSEVHALHAITRRQVKRTLAKKTVRRKGKR